MGGAATLKYRGLARRTVVLSALALALLFLLLMPVGAGATGAAPAFDARGSVEQVYATGVPAGAGVTLRDAGGNVVGQKNADGLGGVLFREVKPGSGYRLEVGSGRSAALTVLTQKSAPPSTSIYNQKIEPHGYQYLTTRDGTKLAIDVHPPQEVLKILTGLVPSPGEGSAGTPELPKLPELPLGQLEARLKETPGLGQALEKLTGLAQRRGLKSHPLKSLLLSNATETTNASSEPKSSAVEVPYVPTGPTPTLIEYGGYGFANPGGPENGISLALAAFEGEKQVRILFDNGAGASPGQPVPAFEESFDQFPIPGTKATAWYLGPGGTLATKPPAGSHADEFTWDASALPLQDFTGNTGSAEGGLWTETPAYHWEQSPPGSAVSYVTAPLSANTTVIGAGAVNVWVKSSTPNVDLQATVSEVRPDGKETFVQNGWLRADERKLDAAKSTRLEPVLSLRESDVEPMPANEFVKLTIPLYYEGHAYRAGSRIRVTIAAPNGTQPIWDFEETEPAGKANVQIAYSKEDPSNLLLPVVPGVKVPTGLPPCPGLRGEPCRTYVPFNNRSVTP